MTVTLATFMEVLDSSIANVALPHIAGSLGATYRRGHLGADQLSGLERHRVAGLRLAFDGFRTQAFLHDLRRSVHHVLVSCAALRAACRLLIVARILQGAGGGGLQPSEQAILADTSPIEKRGMAFALYGMAVVVAPAIGPTLGGWITDNFSWHWIFFINLPIGVLSLFLDVAPCGGSALDQGKKHSGVRIDYIGLALIVIGVACFQMVLDKGQEDDWFAST